MSKRLWLLLVICLLAEQIGAKRSGGLGFGRGSSVARSSPISRGGGTSGGFGRSSSGGFGGIGGFGGGSRPPVKSGNTFGRTTGGIGGFGSGGSSWGRNKGGFGNSRGSFPSSSTSRFRSGSGIGSALRSNTFKNVIVGAAAGYLAYQGGKYLIRSAMAPMMWNNRPYYWGSNYYQPRPNTQMCRMPMQPSDPQFGNIYFNDQSRPREIVWGCGYNEVCCGYECCPAGGMGGMGMGGGGMAPAIGGGAMAGGMMGNTGDAGGGLSVRPAQSIGVRGQLRCNGMPAAGVLVKLYDHDTFTMDDKIASGRSDAQGNFLIAGHANEFTRITPKFNVYHDCNDFLPCQRKISIYIPKHFITEGAMAQKIYDAGQMELSGHFEGESRDCLHK